MVRELIKIGEGFGSTKISGPDQATIRENLKVAIKAQKTRACAEIHTSAPGPGQDKPR